VAKPDPKPKPPPAPKPAPGPFSPTPEVERAAVEHAVAAFPRESVGAVVRGRYETVDVEGTEEDFEIPPKVLQQLERRGYQALVHSHPNGMDSPSDVDMRSQQSCGVPWGVVVMDPKRDDPPRARGLFWFGDELPTAPLEGRPFRHGVHDCASLVRDWYRLNRPQYELPNFPRGPMWWAEPGANFLTQMSQTVPHDAVDPNHLQEGDVVIMAIGPWGVPNHLAVYLGNGLILHHLTRRTSGRDVLNRWHRFVVKVIRLRSR
jgi:cell wall-associated NlpC family hydrolase